MSTTNETARLILEADTKGFDDARKMVILVDGSLNALNASYKAGAITIGQYLTEGARLRGQLTELRDGLDVAEKAVKKYGSAAAAAAVMAEKAGSKMAGFGQSMLQTGRIVQDFQAAGLNGILNNIEGFTQAVGGGAGLAGTLTVLGVAIHVLKPQIKEFIASFDTAPVKLFASQMEAIAARIKELEGKEVKLPVDTLELDQARERLSKLQKGWAAFRAFQEGKTIHEKAAGDEIRKVFEEEGPHGKKVMEDVKGLIGADLHATDRPLRELREKAAKADAQARDLQESADALAKAGRPEAAQRARDAQAARESAEGLRAKAQGQEYKLNNDATAEAGALSSAVFAGNDPAARARFAQMLKRLGHKNLAAQVAIANPEEMKLKSDNEEYLEAMATEKARAERQRRSEAEDERALRHAINQGNAFVTADEKRVSGLRDQAANDSAAGMENAGKKAEADRNEVEKGLGNQFIGTAQQRMIEVTGLRGKARDKADSILRDQIQKGAYQRFLSQGMDAGRAEELVNQVIEFLRSDLGEQIASVRAATRTDSDTAIRAVHQRIGQNLRGSAAPAAAGGLRSIAPTPVSQLTGQPDIQRGLATSLATQGGVQDKLIGISAQTANDVRLLVIRDQQRLQQINQLYGAVNQNSRSGLPRL